MAHTTIYVDFDGVFNTINHMPPTAKSGWGGEWQRRTIHGFGIMWSEELVKFFRELDARDDVTIKVLSTWTTDWTAMLAPELGVGLDWPIVGAETPGEVMEDFANWWKLEALQKDISETNPERVVWIDDDFLFERKAVMTFDNYSFDTLAICPSTSIGLTRAEAMGMLDFINN